MTFSGDETRDIVINEFLADPPVSTANPTGDANHDGTRSASQDEFIELVNSTPKDIDLSGYQIFTRGSSGVSTYFVIALQREQFWRLHVNWLCLVAGIPILLIRPLAVR